MSYQYILRNPKSVRYNQVCRFQNDCRFKNECHYHHLDVVRNDGNHGNYGNRNHANHGNCIERDQADMERQARTMKFCMDRHFTELRDQVQELKKRVEIIEALPTVSKRVAVQPLLKHPVRGSRHKETSDIEAVSTAAKYAVVKDMLQSVPKCAKQPQLDPDARDWNKTVKHLVRGLRYKDDAKKRNARLREVLHDTEEANETASETKRKKYRKIIQTATRIKTVRKRKRPRARRQRKPRKDNETSESNDQHNMQSVDHEYKDECMSADSSKSKSASTKTKKKKKKSRFTPVVFGVSQQTNKHDKLQLPTAKEIKTWQQREPENSKVAALEPDSFFGQLMAAELIAAECKDECMSASADSSKTRKQNKEQHNKESNQRQRKSNSKSASTKTKKKKSRFSPVVFGTPGATNKCVNCGEMGHYYFGCPHRACSTCGKKGHDEVECPDASDTTDKYSSLHGLMNKNDRMNE